MVSKGKLNREELLKIVESLLPTARYQHTLGVMKTALSLATRYGADQQKAEAAAILHDYAKFRPLDEMRQIIQSEPDIPNDLLDYNHELWHAFVGAVLVREELGITDQDILNAIRYHTTGRPGMSPLEKVVFLADYIEPGRRFPGVDDVRSLAEDDLDQAIILALKRTIDFLEGNQKKVYPLTKATYEDLARQRHLTQKGRGVLE
jgi:predicted HD superfamily hydrolase involved in NAD metabolism